VEVGEDLNTPDLSPILNEIVALPDWASGSSLTIMFGHVSGSGTRWVESSAAKGDVMTPALSVTYSVGGGGVGATTEFKFSVTSPLDSGEEEITPGTMYLDSSDLELMHDGADSQQIVGIVFPSVSVPQGSNVASAAVVFEVDEVRPGQSDQDVTISIYGEVGPAAPISAADFDLSSRTPTSASVTWQPEVSTDTGAPLVTPNIASVVAEIVQGSTWASGSGMNIMFGHVAGAGVRWVESFGNTAGTSPALLITYGGAAGAPAPPPPSPPAPPANIPPASCEGWTSQCILCGMDFGGGPGTCGYADTLTIFADHVRACAARSCACITSPNLVQRFHCAACSTTNPPR
jgi:hypothetical protein